MKIGRSFLALLFSGYWWSGIDQFQTLQLGPQLARDGRSEVLYVLPEFGDRARTWDHRDDRGMRQRKLQGSGGEGHPVVMTSRPHLPYPPQNTPTSRGIVVINPLPPPRGGGAPA